MMGESKDERLMFLLDSFLEGKEDSSDHDMVLGAVPMDYVMDYLSTPDNSETGAESAIRSKTEQLLDSFLATDHEKPSFSLQLQIPGDNVQDIDNADAQEEETEQLDESYFTETLARIYLKQHRYDKALEIIRSLYLNFPNKSIYFADQIRYLDILVRINQKNK
jgi:hypothetical protein